MNKALQCYIDRNPIDDTIHFTLMFKEDTANHYSVCLQTVALYTKIIY